MSKKVVMCSPLTSKIYVGNMNNKNTLVDKKEVVTDTAVAAVAQYLLQRKKSVVFKHKGKQYTLAVLKSEDYL